MSHGPQRGFTLVELVAIIALLAVGILSILAVFGSGARTLGINVDSQVGSQLAQERAEEILADRRNPTAGYGYARMNVANYPADVPTAGYNRTVTFTPLVGGACPGGATCQNVRVQVTASGTLAADLVFMVANY